MLTIHLGQDENDCFSAWVSAREAGLAPNDMVDQKGIYSIRISDLYLSFSLLHYSTSLAFISMI
jgi:hypothetical protein